MAALFEVAPTAFTVVRIAGAIYLVYLGVQMIRNRNQDNPDAVVAGGGMTACKAFLNDLFTNLINPKMVTFTIAFLPQFINPAWARSGSSSRSRVRC
ncbi:LysE family translocator [Crossiella cryophila]|uniref:Threonine/homoserine/homoserine lactone efflux protein n=1 Tax=Crossiella cryophila TaxID=43355 RepID=A0A7W7CLW8_9PSEU|nr:LysE family transporter [Crossiella cryophila]MBB4681829.1 threonine/homoserine/homoserine lactone efflux protein [Crossiella cryophila]